MNYNIKINRGADFSVTLPFADVEGDPVDFSTSTFSFAVKKHYQSANSVVVSTITSPEPGYVNIVISRAQTLLFSVGRNVYDCYVTNSTSNTVTQLLSGDFFVGPSVSF